MNKENMYLDIAKNNVISDKQILNDYYKNLANKKKWISRHKVEYNFDKLDRGHLITVIKMLIRFNNEEGKLEGRTILINALLDEAKSRLKY